MWFIFPQMKGLGRKRDVGALRDRLARRGAGVPRPSRPRAAPSRMHRAGRAALKTRTLAEIFGELDAMKYRSCVELFAASEGRGGGGFAEALGKAS